MIANAIKLKTILDEYAARLSRRYRDSLVPEAPEAPEVPEAPEAPEAEVDNGSINEPVSETPE
jgi:hypothetical protein